jgi:hypothetical protein
MNQSRYRLFSLVIIVVIACAVLFFYLLKPAQAPVEEGVLPENPPAGVSVETLENGERLVRNEERGYSVQINSGKHLYTDKFDTNDLVIQDFFEPDIAYGGVPGCRATIFSEIGSLDNIFDITKKNCETREECVDVVVTEDIKFGTQQDWTEIQYLGEFVGAGLPKYKTEVAGNIYSVYFECNDEAFIKDILGNFHLN